MTRIMRDSTVIADIPVAGTQIVLAYVNGKYAASPAAVAARFPHVPVAWVDVTGADPHADVADVELGDLTPAGAAAWVREKLALKPAFAPILYVNRSNVTPVFNALASAGLQVVRDFKTIIATLDGTTRVADMTGVVAVQNRGQVLTGGHWDESLVYDDTWMTAALPAPPPGITLAQARAAAETVLQYLG